MASLTVYPAVGGDDYHWRSTYLDNTTEELQLGVYSTIRRHFGIRFPNVTIPQGSIINSAIIRIYAGTSGGTGSVSPDIYFNEVDDAVAPTNVAGVWNNWNVTPIAWPTMPNEAPGVAVNSPDITTHLQAIINRAGWVSGNAVQFFIYEPTTTGYRFFRAIEYGAGSHKAELIITYTPGKSYNFTSTPIEITSELTFGVGINGDIGLSLPSLTASFEGTSRSASLNLDLPALSMVLTGSTGSTGHIDLTLPQLQFAASGFGGNVGSVEFDLPSLAVSFTGYTNIPWKFDLTLPSLRVMFSGGAVATAYSVIVINPRNMAVSEYDWSGFNSFALFNGQYLGAKSTGIYALGGDNDAGLPIASEIELGQLPVGPEKPRDIYILGRAGGTMAVELSADENTEKEVNFSDMLETLNQGRVKIPRGIDPSAYYSLKLKNKNGSDFDIDEIQVYGEAQSRKKK